MYLQSRIKGIAILILVFGTSCGSKPQFGIEAEAKSKLASLPGKIGVKFQTRDQEWNYSIIDGELVLQSELPDAPKEANSITSGTFITNILPEQMDIYYRGPYLISPDKSLIVAAIEYRGANLSLPSDFVITDFDGKQIFFKRRSKKIPILKGIAWSPDSRFFAVIQSSQKPVLGLRNTLSAMAGHPVRSNTYFLLIYDRKGDLYVQSEIASGLIGSSVMLIWEP